MTLPIPAARPNANISTHAALSPPIALFGHSVVAALPAAQTTFPRPSFSPSQPHARASSSPLLLHSPHSHPAGSRW